MEILEALEAERIFIYAMGMEPWLEHLLGLGYTPDAVQILESNKLLIDTRDRGFAVTERLYGKREIRFSEFPAGQTPAPKRPSTRTDEQVPLAATGRESREELEGEFIFD